MTRPIPSSWQNKDNSPARSVPWPMYLRSTLAFTMLLGLMSCRNQDADPPAVSQPAAPSVQDTHHDAQSTSDEPPSPSVARVQPADDVSAAEALEAAFSRKRPSPTSSSAPPPDEKPKPPLLEVTPGFVEPVAQTAEKPEPDPSSSSKKPQSRPERDRDASDDFFDEGRIPELRIVLKPDQEQKLRENQRNYAKCSIIETLRDPKNPSHKTETKYEDVAIKVKGAAGSTRDLNDKPALTLNTNKHVKGQKFHGLDKFHLNNSVQDESYLNEWICADLCHDMDVPAARVTHARVWLNGRDLGLFVLKEGFDKTFLRRHFGNSSGNLYDGGFLQDIEVALEKDEGKDPNDRSDLTALKAACEEPDLVKRAERLEERLDVDEFLSFVALELLTCHWDGYVNNKNNYRIYFHPEDGKARFLPHGMDQMFGDPGFPVLYDPPTIVSGAVMRVPEFRQRYAQRVREVLPLFEAKRLGERLDLAMSRLQPVVKAMGPNFANPHADRAREFRDRLSARGAAIREQLDRGPPMPLEFNEENLAEVNDWFHAQETDDVKFEEVEENEATYHVIEVGPSGQCVASLRRQVLLARGRYRLEVKLKTMGVVPRSDQQGTGAGVRISGGSRDNKRTGTSKWATVSYDFEVAEDVREVVLVAELRATKGRLWIDPRAILKRLDAEKPQ